MMHRNLKPNVGLDIDAKIDDIFDGIRTTRTHLWVVVIGHSTAPAGYRKRRRRPADPLLLLGRLVGTAIRRRRRRLVRSLVILDGRSFVQHHTRRSGGC